MRSTAAAALLLLFALPLAAAPPESAGQWMTAVPPRKDLPRLEISVGYPGGYLPNGFVPVAMRAVATDRPFDGAFSFHFSVPGRSAFATPVIVRVRLDRGQTWSFGTWGRITPARPELEVEWRDAALESLARVRVANLPVHLPRVLRVVDGKTPPPASTLGSPTYAVAVEDLSGEAQWYAGFRALALPTAVWLGLPAQTREAILGSGIFVVFIGVPDSHQNLDARDRALLPVSFESKPANYARPWPYGTPADPPVPTPISWRAVNEARPAGSSDAPYIVTTGAGGAAWVADEKALERDLPAIEFNALGVDRVATISGSRPSPRQLLREHVEMLVTILAALLSLTLWLVSRRTPRWAFAAAAIIAATLIVGANGRLRPVPDRQDVEVVTPVAPGLVERYRARYTSGTSPLPAEARPAELARTSLNGMDQIIRRGEVRTAGTVPGTGSTLGFGAYAALVRWSSRRETGTAPSVRVVHHDRKSLTLRYDAPEPVDEVHARWVEGGEWFAGSVLAGERTSGEVTVRAGQYAWTRGGWFLDSGPAIPRAPTFGDLIALQVAKAQRINDERGVSVRLIHRTRRRTTQYEWSRATLTESPAEPLCVTGSLRQTPGGDLSGLFMLPVQRLPRGKAFVSLRHRIPVSSVTLSWPGGSVELPRSTTAGADISTRAFPIAAGVLDRIAASGGLFEVSVRGTKPLPPETTSFIELWGKS